MAASDRNGADRLLPEFIGQLPQLGAREIAQGRRIRHLVQKWCAIWSRHWSGVMAAFALRSVSETRQFAFGSAPTGGLKI
jgi:hypothetical protein